MNLLKKNEKFRIIALDDVKLIHVLLSDIISSDYELKLVKSIGDFNDSVDGFKPHMILLDLVLPDGNGVDICRKLREKNDYFDTFILILTGSTEKSVIEDCYDAGADDFIRKPFIPYEIKSKIEIFERILRSRSNLNMAYSKQLDLNKKLYWLGDFIQKNLSFSEIGEYVETAIDITEAVDVTYFELIFQEENSFHSQIERKYNNTFPVRTFNELNNKHNIIAKINDKFSMIKVVAREQIIYCCIINFNYSNKVTVYLLLEKDSAFTDEEREILVLFSEFISIMNGRVTFERQIKKKNIEYKSEITKIRKIQSLIFPDFSAIKGYDVAFAYLPAQELSGDFFDGFYIDENTYQIILCDVSGHGIASSYVGNQVRINFRIASMQGESPAAIASSVNKALARDLKGSYYYCTAIVCQIDIVTGTIRYLSAGHPESMLFDVENNICKRVKFTSPLIGLFEDNTYSDVELKMNSGDTLLLYTDGITEASTSDKNDLFGVERMENVFIENQNFSSQNIIHSVAGAMYEFTEHSEQDDDITIICLKKK